MLRRLQIIESEFDEKHDAHLKLSDIFRQDIPVAQKQIKLKKKTATFKKKLDSIAKLLQHNVLGDTVYEDERKLSKPSKLGEKERSNSEKSLKSLKKVKMVQKEKQPLKIEEEDTIKLRPLSKQRN
jgi:hypothetical protein